MSSLWATMKKRRGSSNTNLTSGETVGGRTPSGRSSSSRDSRDDRRSRPSSADEKEDALTSRVSRLAEQVLPRSGFRSLRLPPALSKGFATGSLPRHLPSSSADSETHSDSLQGKEVNESKRPRGTLMGLSTDRFPAPLKNLLQRPRGKPPPPPQKTPCKPSRRPGPVGKSWVKVYDDIIYIDDPSAEEMMPILGYTGHPTVVPDAEPLPVAPTPPPEHTKTPENVSRRRKELERKSPSGEDKENISPNVTGITKPPPPAARSGRSREISRYKGRRQKRSGTPIGRDIQMDAENEEVLPKKEDDNDEVMEDGYIIPQSLKPPKPPRGNKIYETINGPSQEKAERKIEETGKEIPQPKIESEPPRPKRGMKIYESIVIKTKDGEHSTTTETPTSLNVSLDDEQKRVEHPPKPKRGIKIYETIEIGFRVDPTKEKSPSKILKTKAEDERLKEEKNESHSSIERRMEAIQKSPPKPSRRNKVYETATTTHSTSDSAPPTQGQVETTVHEEGDKTSNDDKTESEISSSKNGGIPLYAKVQKLPRPKESAEDGGFIPLIREEIDRSLPPPVPPKKKRPLLKEPQVVVENVYDVLPCRPPRRLKSRPRSCDASPLRPKRHRFLPTFQENGFSPHKPARNFKLRSSNIGNSAGELDRASTLPLPKSKRKDMKSFDDVEDRGGTFPPKPLRNSQSRLLPAPPRRKKLNRSFDEDQIIISKDNQIPLSKNESQVPFPKNKDDFTIPGAQDSTVQEYIPSNVSLSLEIPPPPPPKRGKLAAAGTDAEEISIPKTSLKENAQSQLSESESVTELERDSNKLSLRLERREDSVAPELDSSDSKLDVDIENNLKKIESSFETLDTVIQCLKKYASTGSLSEADKIVLTDDSVCDNVLKPPDSEYHYKDKSESELGIDIDKTKPKDLLPKESANESVDSEINDLSLAISDAETVICVEKSGSQDSLNLIDNIASSNDLGEGNKDTKNSAAVPSRLLNECRENSIEEEEIEPKPIEVSFVIKSDQPVSLPTLEDFHAKPVEVKGGKSSEPDVISQIPLELKTTIKSEIKDKTVTTEIPLKLSTTEKSEFKFEQCAGEVEDKEKTVTTEIPVKLSTVDKSEFKFESPGEIETKEKSVTTEIPIKLPTTEKSEFKFVPFAAETETKEKSITTEIPLKLSTTEKSEFKLVPSETETENKEKSITTEIPLKLPTTEKSEFKFVPSETETETKEKSIATEIPLKLSTTEKSEFKFVPSETETENKEKSITTEIPLKLSTTEKSEFKFVPSETETETKEKSITTEIPLKLSTTEKSEFKFVPSETETETKEKSITTEIPLKLSTTEKSEFKFVPSETETENKEKSIITEIPLKLSTTEKSEFKLVPSETETENKEKSITTEIPLKLSTTEKSEFKFVPSETEAENKEKSITTEIPLKLSTTEKSEFKLVPSETETETKEKSITTEIPLKLSTTEKSEFKFVPSETETENKEKSIITEIPLKLSTTEKSEFKFVPSETETENKGKSITTEIPLKLPTVEKSEFKFEQTLDVSAPKISSLTSTELNAKLLPFHPVLLEANKEIPDKYKLYLTEQSPIKVYKSQTTGPVYPIPIFDLKSSKLGLFTPSLLISEKEKLFPKDFLSSSVRHPEPTTDKSQIKEKSVTTEIPIKLSTTEKSEFKFEPSATETETKEKLITTEIPLKLSAVEKSEFKFEPTLDVSAPKISSLTSTELNAKLLPFHPVLLEAKKEIPDKYRVYLTDQAPANIYQSQATKTAYPIPIFDLKSSKFGLFAPSLLISEKEKLLPKGFLPTLVLKQEEQQSKSEPKPKESFTSLESISLKHERQVSDVSNVSSSPQVPVSNVDQKLESKVERALQSNIPSSSVSFNSLSPQHLALFSPKLLEGKKELSEKQKRYSLEYSPETTPENWEYLEYIKSIPFYDLTPTDILPFSPTTLVSEEELSDILTPKGSTPEPEALPIPLVKEPAAADQSSGLEVTSRLQGIHSQLEAIITNYPTSTSSSYSSLDTALSEVSNRSSLCLDFPSGTDSPVSSSFYSPTSEIEQQNYSLCSTPLTFYTAATPSEKSFLTDSGTNTPGSSSNSSLKADDDYEIEEDECATAPVQDEEHQKEF